MRCGLSIVLFVYLGYIDLYKPSFYVNGKVGDSCSGNDTSTCGSQPTYYTCKRNSCWCELKKNYEDDSGDCVPYKDPDPPEKVEIINVTASSFTVSWTKPQEYPGPLFYRILIYEAERRSSEIADDNVKIDTQLDYNITEYFYDTHVVGDWSYRAAVIFHLHNDERSNATYSNQIRTPTAPSGVVQSFRVIVLGYNHSSAEVWWRCPNEKQRNGILTNYTIAMKLNGSEENTLYTIPEDDYANKDFCKYEKNIVIKPGSAYTFTIRANNEDYLGEEYVEQYIAEEATPYLSQQHSAIFKYDPVSTTKTTITFEYCSKCLLDDSNGAITYSAILICHYVHCKDRRLETVDEQVIRKFTTWKQAKEADFNSPFLVTQEDFIKLSNDSDFSTFTAGIEKGCDEKPADTVCNGPLEPDTAYQAIAFTCTRVGCSSTFLGGEGWYRTQDKDNTIPIVVGILAAVVALVLIGVIVILYQKGMLPCSKKPYSVCHNDEIKM